MEYWYVKVISVSYFFTKYGVVIFEFNFMFIELFIRFILIDLSMMDVDFYLKGLVRF